jgi:hypothetical protein
LLLIPGHAGRGSATSSASYLTKRKPQNTYRCRKQTNDWGEEGAGGPRRSCCKARRRQILILKSCAVRECQNLNGHSITSTATVVVGGAATALTNQNASERERAATREPWGSSAFTYHQLTRGERGGREWRFFVITAGTTPASLLTNHLTNLNH